MRNKALRHLAFFLIFMMVCTMISRGVYANQMPQVTAARAEAKNITHAVEAAGHVVAVAERAVTAQVGIRVKDVCVAEGWHVKKGDVLFYLNQSELSRKAAQLSGQIAEKQEEINKILDKEQEQERKQEKKRQQERKQLSRRGRQDLETVRRQQEELVTKAKREYEKAKLELARYPAWEQYLASELEKNAEYQSQKAAAEKRDAAKEEKENFAIYYASLEKNLFQDWQNGKKEREEAESDRKALWEDAKREKQLALQVSRQEADRAVEDLETGEQQEDGQESEEWEALQKEIQKLTKMRDKYQTLLQQGGAVKSKWAGTVLRIQVSVGERTPDGAAVILSNDRKGKKFVATLKEEEKRNLQAGDTVQLVFRDGTIKLADVEVQNISYGDDGSCQVSTPIDDERVEAGEDGLLQFEAETEKQSCCIPVSGLYTGGAEQYVLVLKETETFLGTEYYLEKRSVAALDKNEEYVALKNSPLEEGEKIVVASTKEVKAGDVVRMKE